MSAADANALALQVANASEANAPAGTLESLLKPENKVKLAGILTYHVVPGKVMAADVVKTDVAASNGVIHVIDTILLPKSRPAGCSRPPP